MDDNFYDVIVVGGGPAGLTAALYLARARYRVLVVEKERFGGQITITLEVVNYPGVERGSGEEITLAMRRQAQRFGAEFLLAEAEGFSLDGPIKTVRTSRGAREAFGVVLATGAHPRMVGFRGEAEFKGRGVAYCATCDGEFFTGLDVFVVGGGFAAAEESVFLTKYARKVTVLVREADFTCAKATADLVKENEHIEVRYRTVVEEVSGDTALRRASIKNLDTGEIWAYSPPEGETFGLFVFAGYEPATAPVKNVVALDERGYVVTDKNRKTNLEGVYAAGDVCVKNLRQMVTATGDGAVAATELERYVARLQKETGRVPRQPVSRVAPESVAAKPAPDTAPESFFTPEVAAQLAGVFERMEQPLILRAALDERPVSEELRGFLRELTGLTDKLSLAVAEEAEAEAPVVRICRADGADTGLAFHGVPGGHEFNSFVVGLYNAAGPGQALEAATLGRVRALGRPVRMRILVSLSCTMCPELVMAAQRIAAENPRVTAEVYDINHFSALKDEYKVMSVPCLVLDDGTVTFGKKTVAQLLDLLGA
ncbi:MAG: FAD-dependent oxidoreductase [Oscillospiraceae bacterium]|jgi:thioredoxin reductase (NADPH)|nr:FAD-dependent oxidoreductase [Oscillospiraceae bacterium]